MARQLKPAAIAAKAIREELKAIGVKAKVTSKTYSMGNSVTVKTFNLPPAVENAVKDICEKYEYGYFDGMTDSYEVTNINTALPAQVAFVFVINTKTAA